MALISEIRQRSWILIVLIGLAMLGFIFMDMFGGNRSILSGRGMEVGTVDGDDIDQREFERSYNALYATGGGDAYEQRQQLWNYMVEDRLIRAEARELGLVVPEDELTDLISGTELSPVIQQRFRDAQTGQVNRENLNSFRDAEANGTINDPTVVDPARKDFWFFQKTEVNKQRLQDKLASLVAKAMYVPDWQAKEIAKNQETRVDLAFVKVPYDSIPDASVTLADADYDAFMKEEGSRFIRKEPGRGLAYVSFAVAATPADSTKLVSDLNDLKTKWATATKDSTFVQRNKGTFPATYVPTEQLPAALVGVEVGTIVGPFIDNGKYTLSKVVDRMTVPDSVRARHILLPAQASSRSLADSLINLIKTGTNTFEELAQQFSTDPGSSSLGGDLGYSNVGRMVPEFNDLIFYSAKDGELNKVVTQFGLHIVEVTGRKVGKGTTGTRIASLSKAIEPSAETQKTIRQRAAQFAQSNRSVAALREAVAKDASLTLVEGIVVGANDYAIGQLPSSNSSRDIVKYAFDPREGEVAPLVYAYKAPEAFYDGQYIVAATTGEVAAGVPTWSTVKSIIEPEVRQRKKAALVASAGASDLGSVASRYGVSVDTASAVNFGSAFVPQLGPEGEVLAKAFSTPTQQVSAPIAGSTGVFVIKPLVRTEPGESTADLQNVRRSTMAQISSGVRSRLGYAMRESAEISDNRQRFY